MTSSVQQDRPSGDILIWNAVASLEEEALNIPGDRRAACRKKINVLSADIFHEIEALRHRGVSEMDLVKFAEGKVAALNSHAALFCAKGSDAEERLTAIDEKVSAIQVPPPRAREVIKGAALGAGIGSGVGFSASIIKGVADKRGLEVAKDAALLTAQEARAALLDQKWRLIKFQEVTHGVLELAEKNPNAYKSIFVKLHTDQLVINSAEEGLQIFDKKVAEAVASAAGKKILQGRAALVLTGLGGTLGAVAGGLLACDELNPGD